MTPSATAGIDLCVLGQLCQQLNLRLDVDFCMNRPKKIRLAGSYDSLITFAETIEKPASFTGNLDSNAKGNTEVGKARLPPKGRNCTDKTQLESMTSSDDETQALPQTLGSNAAQPSPTATPTTPKANDLDSDDGCEKMTPGSAVSEEEKTESLSFQLNSLTVEYVRKVRHDELSCIEKRHGVQLLETIDRPMGTSMVSVELLSGERGTKALEEGYRKVRELCTDVSKLRFTEKKIPFPPGKTGFLSDLLRERLRPSVTRCLIEVNDQISLYGTQDDVKSTTDKISRIFTTAEFESRVPAIAGPLNDHGDKRDEFFARELRYYTKCGSIENENVDVVVCGINADIKQQSGAARAIFSAVGKDLENDCKTFLKKKAKTKFGAVMPFYVKGQPFQYAFFAVIHGGKTLQQSLKTAVGPGQSLTDIFFSCLEKAMEVKAKSIAVPALGCRCGLQTQECVETLLTTVDRFLEIFGRECLLEKIVFIDKDEDVVQEFKKQVSKMKQRDESLSVSNPSPRPASLTKASSPGHFDRHNEPDKAKRRSNSTSSDRDSGSLDIVF